MKATIQEYDTLGNDQPFRLIEIMTGDEGVFISVGTTDQFVDANETIIILSKPEVQALIGVLTAAIAEPPTP